MALHGISYLNAPGHTGETWNPVVGCTAVSEGCKSCYAQRAAGRGVYPHKGLTKGGRWTGEVRLIESQLAKPLKWTRKPRMVLTCSMGDLFHRSVPSAYIAAVFGVMAATPKSTFLVLTKRIGRAKAWLESILYPPDWWGDHPWHPLIWMESRTRDYSDAHPRLPHGRLTGGTPAPPWPVAWPLTNVAIGVTVENQWRANERFPHLAAIGAMGWPLWLSYEPALGPIDLNKATIRSPKPLGRHPEWIPPLAIPGLKFVAVGAETGPRARPCPTEWLRSAVDQCESAGIACHVKQLGKGAPPDDVRGDWPRDFPRTGATP